MVNLKVNKNLLPIKAHYFLFNAGNAPMLPFIPTFARQLGIPSSGIGIMHTIFSIAAMIAKPSFGALADKFNMGKVIFMSFIVLTAAFYCCMSLIPAKQTQAEMEIDCSNDSGMTLLKTCNIQDNCTLTRIDLKDPNHMMECKLSCPHPNADFLNQMCTAWNISDACTTSNLTVIEMTIFSNTSGALYDYQSCLSFPVETVVYDQDHLYHPLCDGASTRCNVVCDSAIVMSYLQDQVIDNLEESYWSTIQFQLLLCLMCGAFIGWQVVNSLSDSICFALLGDKPQNFGAQRLWGAFGWAVTVTISGYLIDLSSAGQLTKDYTPAFCLTGIFLAINFFSVIPIKVDYCREPNAFKKAFSLAKNIRVVLHLLSCVTFGICMASIWQFHLMFLEDLAVAQAGCDSQFNWIKLLEGLSQAVQIFGEIPFLFVSGLIIKKLGHVYTMTMILLVTGIRLLCYSFLINPWFTLLIDLLHGITTGTFLSAMASYANVVAPAGADATLQGIFGAAFEGLGVAIGNLLGGFLYERYGGAMLFRSFGIYVFVYGIIYCLIHVVIDRVDSSKSNGQGTEDHNSTQ